MCFGSRALEHARHLGTWPLKHLRQLGTQRALGHLDTQRALRHSGNRAFELSRHLRHFI